MGEKNPWADLMLTDADCWLAITSSTSHLGQWAPAFLGHTTIPPINTRHTNLNLQGMIIKTVTHYYHDWKEDKYCILASGSYEFDRQLHYLSSMYWKGAITCIIESTPTGEDRPLLRRPIVVDVISIVAVCCTTKKSVLTLHMCFLWLLCTLSTCFLTRLCSAIYLYCSYFTLRIKV